MLQKQVVSLCNMRYTYIVCYYEYLCRVIYHTGEHHEEKKKQKNIKTKNQTIGNKKAEYEVAIVSDYTDVNGIYCNWIDMYLHYEGKYDTTGKAGSV